MSIMKGTSYCAPMKNMGTGGFRSQSTQPQSAWTSAGSPTKGVKSQGALKQTFKPTCKTCGGKF